MEPRRTAATDRIELLLYLARARRDLDRALRMFMRMELTDVDAADVSPIGGMNPPG